MTGKRCLTWLMILVLAVAVVLPAVPAEAADPEAPAAVTGVKISNKTAQMLTISWSPVPGAEGYRVKYSTGADMKKAKTKSVADQESTHTPAAGIAKPFYRVKGSGTSPMASQPCIDNRISEFVRKTVGKKSRKAVKTLSGQFREREDTSRERHSNGSDLDPG